MKTRKILKNLPKMAAISAILVGISNVVRSESPSITGFIESTYMYDFNEPNTGATGLRSYDATANNFYLNAVHLAIAGELEGASYTVEIDHGSDSTVTGSNTDIDVQEAYLTFPVGPVSFTTGKFVTYEGIEVIEGPDNPTISRGYLYGMAEAFTHVGGKAHIGLGEHVDVGLGLVNGRDIDTDNNDGKTVLWRLGLDFGDPFAIGFSGSHGPDNDRAINSPTDEDMTTSFDVTGSLGIIPKLPIAFQYLFAQQGQRQSRNQFGGNLVRGWDSTDIRSDRLI